MTRLLLVSLCVLSCLATAAAREWPLTLKDYTGRGFPPDLVHYTMPQPAEAGKLSVTGPGGTSQPVQVTPGKDGMATISFIAALPAHAMVTYTLRDDGPAVQAGVRTAADADGLVLDNGLLAVRVPTLGEKTLAPPMPADTLPAPILAFKSGQNPWMGAGVMRCTRPVKAFRVRQTASGSVFAEVRYEMEFANGGYYRAIIQVADGLPFAKISEEYDMREISGRDFWELDLTRGWAPDTAETAMMNRNGSFTLGEKGPLAQLGPTPNPIRAPWCIISGNAWGPRSLFGVTNAAEEKANPAGAAVAGFAPLHNGQWRRPAAVEIRTPDCKQVSLYLPISVRPVSWLTEVSSDVSPFSTHEHDSALPATYGRRIWGLVLAQPAWRMGAGACYATRILYGTVGLDTYKDYVLQWPDTRAAYPRVVVQKADLEAIRKAAPASPLAPVLAHYYCISGNEEDARNNLRKLKDALNHWISYWMSTAFPGHGNGGAEVAVLADDVLSWPGLSAADREEIRAKLALFTYLFVDPDLQNRNGGTHNGNPNMGAASQGCMPLMAALLPDHPMQRAWRDWMAEFMAYKVGSFMAPGGGWFEYGSYHMHGYKPLYRGIMGLDAMGASNAEVLHAYNRADWDYWLNLLSPVDPRWRARMIPGSANSFPYYSGESYEGPWSLGKYDQQLAAYHQWAWLASGADYYDADPRKGADSTGAEFINALAGRPDIAPVEPKLTSRIFPGVGVIFRSHQGPDETYLYFRSGYNWSHWHNDQGGFYLYSKGAVLVPDQPYQYYDSAVKADTLKGFSRLHENILRFWHPENEYDYAWPDSNILDHAFGPTVDYAWASIGYPEWYLQGRKKGFEEPRTVQEGLNQAPGGFHWERQVMFLKGQSGKSPNYFVIRDSTTGAGKPASWWNMNLLGTKASIAQDGTHIAVNTNYPTKLDLLFAQKTPPAVEMVEDLPRVSLGGWCGPAWWNLTGNNAPPKGWVDENGNQTTDAKNMGRVFEQHVLLRIPGAAGQGFFWVAYPRGEGETAPKTTELAPGVMKVETSESTDYVFLSPVHFTYQQDALTFAGCSGVIRVHKDSVTLALCGGAGQVGYQGQVLVGTAPFERTLPLRGLKKGVETIPAPKYAISHRPQLTGHQPVAPGVVKATAGDVTEYLIDAPAPVTLADGAVRIQARKAALCVSPKGTRVTALDGTYTEITAGTYGARGVGPFDLTISDTGVTGTVDGATRTVVVTKPKKILRAMYRMDGVRWYAGIPDETSDYETRTTPQFSLALGVTDGKHTVEVSEWTFPSPPPQPDQARIK